MERRAHALIGYARASNFGGNPQLQIDARRDGSIAASGQRTVCATRRNHMWNGFVFSGFGVPVPRRLWKMVSEETAIEPGTLRQLRTTYRTANRSPGLDGRSRIE